LTYAEPGCETRALRLDEGVLRREQEALAFNRAAYDLWMGQAIEALHRAGECRGQLAALTARAVRAEARERLRREAFSFFMDF
ncbi:MAG: hypothetical protein IJS53_03415, partial [Clostridia bacterium]|nr:hypothetical protein [Clostridia bacterium]